MPGTQDSLAVYRNTENWYQAVLHSDRRIQAGHLEVEIAKVNDPPRAPYGSFLEKEYAYFPENCLYDDRDRRSTHGRVGSPH
jgi:hypothetical protein